MSIVNFAIIILVLFCSTSLYADNKKCTEFLTSIIGTENKKFNPTTDYRRIFASELSKLEPKPGGFLTTLLRLKQLRADIAKGNADDQDLYQFLTSPASANHMNGKSEDMTNVTSLYPKIPYGSLSARYEDLYAKLYDLHKKGQFSESDNNELTQRYARQAKQGRKIADPDRSWILHYEKLNGQRRSTLIGGVVVVRSRLDEPLFGIYNSFSKDVPAILKHLATLWGEILTTDSTQIQKQKIAEFEWLFFYSNPLGRAAASIGDIMSLTLQIATGQKLRAQFIHLDFEALSRDRKSYVEWRVPQM